MSLSLAGANAVITGSSRGIGLAVAERFVEAGASVHLIADDEEVLEWAAALRGTAAIADISNAEAVCAALKPLSRIDVLVNNAGLEQMTPVTDSSAEAGETFRRILDINVLGTALVTRHALASMRPGGSIVNTASICGRIAQARFDAYVASKHAIIGLTKTWARELGSKGLRVNAVCPGWVETRASMRSLDRMAEQEDRERGQLLDEIVEAQALPGLMKPSDVADIYLFLASSMAANITGQSVAVDRGEVPW